MATMPSSRFLRRPKLAPTQFDAALALLVPSAQCAGNASSACFSTSSARWKKDNNKNRGVSAVKATALRPRQTLSVRQKDFETQQLPKPVPVKHKVTGTPDHGLWGFFKNQQLLQTPLDEQRHGRAWTVGELRTRDWDALHQLWWICVKERNRLATEKIERKRLNAGYGDFENQERDKTVQETMQAILDSLAERRQAYREALVLAQNDPDIDFSKTGLPRYTTPPYDPLEADDTPDDTAAAPTSQEPAKDLTIAEPKEKVVV
ncbi:54S ribosomal protein L4 mitochondrial [Exserohilum turcicum]